VASQHIATDCENDGICEVTGNDREATGYERDFEEDDAEDATISRGFVMKNGCCRECMKAFSKNGKVSVQFLL